MRFKLIKLPLVFFKLSFFLIPIISYGAGYEDFMRLITGTSQVIVTDLYDLEGRSVTLEKRSTLRLVGRGRIINGRIVGKESTITSAKHGIGVVLAGSWKQSTIFDTFFDWTSLDDNTIIKNIEVLQSEDIFNTISLSKDKYILRIEKENGYCIYPSSNSFIIIESLIEIEPNDYKSYSIIYIRRKQNVGLSGGGMIRGDVGKHKYAKESSSEWGMGVKIDESSNVKISNLSITKCIGDGIYITGGNEVSIGSYDHASRDIVIDKVICDDNRRQGISVIHVDGLIVSDCSLINTGLTDFTKPGAGIDIEPNVSNGRNMSVRNINVTNCRAMNNGQYDYVTSGCVYENGTYNFENVRFTRCSSNGVCYFTSPVLLKDSDIGSLKLLGYSTPIDVIVESTTINNGIDFHCPRNYVPLPDGKKIINSLSLKGCRLNCNSKFSKSRLFRRMAGSMENVGTIRIANTEINIKGEENGLSQLKDNQIPPITVTNSVISMPGCDFIPQNNRYRKVIFRCSSVFGFEGVSKSLFKKCKVEPLGENKTLSAADYYILFIFIAFNLVTCYENTFCHIFGISS